MLVLSRKRSERIWISKDICITIVKLDRHQVRLGIEAPSDVPIVREEVLKEAEMTSNTPALA
ncbi:MAG: carbon storage regulator [Isosphaeraceae bacterium]